MDFWHATIQICATEQRVGLLRVKLGVRQGYIIVYTCYLPCVRTVEFSTIFIPSIKYFITSVTESVEERTPGRGPLCASLNHRSKGYGQ